MKVFNRLAVAGCLTVTVCSAPLLGVRAGVYTAGDVCYQTGRSTPKGFADDFDIARKAAAASGKNLWVLFTGSDWCHWCIKLERECLSKPDFVSEGIRSFELVFLDFPKDGKLVLQKTTGRNKELLRRYSVEGFPTILLVDPEGEVIARPDRPGAEETPAEYFARMGVLAARAPEIAKFIRPYARELETLKREYADRRRAIVEVLESEDRASVDGALAKLKSCAEEIRGLVKAVRKRFREAEIPETLKEEREGLLQEMFAEIKQLRLVYEGKYDEETRRTIVRGVRRGDRIRIENVPPVPKERVAAIEKAERDFLRRQLYDPVAEHLASESAERREQWKDILQTAEDSLYYFGGGCLEVHRGHVGRGAIKAYEAGCRYPLPITFAFSSVFRKKEDIRKINGELHASLAGDPFWNPAVRLVSAGFFEIEGNTPEGVDARAEVVRAAARFLTETEYGPDELGMVYHLVAFTNHRDPFLAVTEAEKSGRRIDPWLRLMLEASGAHKRAWNARGGGYANTVSNEGWRVYREESAKVLPLCEKAWKLRPELPQSAWLALQSCMGDPDGMNRWLSRVLASRPDMTSAFAEYLFGSRPRWCGSTRKMANFLIMLARRGEFDTEVPIFAYESLAGDVYNDEGGIDDEDGGKESLDEFVRNRREIFEPYFRGYRESGFVDRTDYIVKCHACLALGEIAWRLGNEEEKEFWLKKFLDTGMPAGQVRFGQSYPDVKDEVYRLMVKELRSKRIKRPNRKPSGRVKPSAGNL